MLAHLKIALNLVLVQKRNVHLVSLALADRYLQRLVKTISVAVKCLALNVKRNAFIEKFSKNIEASVQIVG